jgi:hypothetical protein
VVRPIRVRAFRKPFALPNDRRTFAAAAFSAPEPSESAISEIKTPASSEN